MSNTRPSPGIPDADPDVPPDASSRRDSALWLLCGGLILVFAVLRSYHLHLPADFSFDERHFVENARRYLLHLPDRNDHPPLGKLVIAASIALLGDNALGWRFPALLAGWLNIGLAGALARTVYRDRLAGLLAATLVAVDGFLLVYSRTALLDGQLVSLFLGSALAASRAAFGERALARSFAVAAVLAGLATSVKFSGIVLVAPLVAVLVTRRAALPRWAPALLALVPLAYAVPFALGLRLSGLDHGPLDVVRATRHLVDVHLGLTDGENRWVSRWYTWWLPGRPIVMRWDRTGETVRAMTGLANLALWWGGQLLLLGALWGVVRAGPPAWRAWMSGRDAAPAPSFFVHQARANAWMALLAFVPIVPWIVTQRDSYLYHALPAYVFVLVLVAGGLAWLWRRRPTLAGLALLVVVAVSLAYLPTWIELPIPRWLWRTLMFVRYWRWTGR